MNEFEPDQLVIFISYSRKDHEFCKALSKSLRTDNYVVIYDQATNGNIDPDLRLTPQDEWWLSIKSMIAGCDVMIFITSPDSAKSDACDDEIAYAKSLGKRIVPVLYRDLDLDIAPERLRSLNIRIDFRSNNQEEFDAAFSILNEELRTDVEWDRFITRLTRQADRWVQQGKPDASLLREDAVHTVTEFVTKKSSTNAELGDLVQLYLERSLDFENRATAKLKKAIQYSYAKAIEIAMSEHKQGTALRYLAAAATLTGDWDFSFFKSDNEPGRNALIRAGLKSTASGYAAILDLEDVNFINQSQCENYLATGSRDGLCVWDLRDNTLLAQFEDEKGAITISGVSFVGQSDSVVFCSNGSLFRANKMPNCYEKVEFGYRLSFSSLRKNRECVALDIDPAATRCGVVWSDHTLEIWNLQNNDLQTKARIPKEIDLSTITHSFKYDHFTSVFDWKRRQIHIPTKDSLFTFSYDSNTTNRTMYSEVAEWVYIDTQKSRLLLYGNNSVKIYELGTKIEIIETIISLRRPSYDGRADFNFLMSFPEPNRIRVTNIISLEQENDNEFDWRPHITERDFGLEFAISRDGKLFAYDWADELSFYCLDTGRSIYTTCFDESVWRVIFSKTNGTVFVTQDARSPSGPNLAVIKLPPRAVQPSGIALPEDINFVRSSKDGKMLLLAGNQGCNRLYLYRSNSWTRELEWTDKLIAARIISGNCLIALNLNGRIEKVDALGNRTVVVDVPIAVNRGLFTEENSFLARDNYGEETRFADIGFLDDHIVVRIFGEAYVWNAVTALRQLPILIGDYTQAFFDEKNGFFRYFGDAIKDGYELKAFSVKTFSQGDKWSKVTARLADWSFSKDFDIASVKVPKANPYVLNLSDNNSESSWADKTWLSAPDSNLVSARVSPCGHFIITADNITGKVILWHSDLGAIIKTLELAKSVAQCSFMQNAYSAWVIYTDRTFDILDLSFLQVYQEEVGLVVTASLNYGVGNVTKKEDWADPLFSEVAGDLFREMCKLLPEDRLDAVKSITKTLRMM